MALKISNVLAMVTGGASGLGRATAQHFLKHGAKVVILDLPPKDESSVYEGLDENRTLFCNCDVTDSNDVTDAIEMTKHKFGRPNVLVNCAGTIMNRVIYNRAMASPHQFEIFEKLINTNTVGTFNTIRLLTPEFIENDPDCEGQRGVIINTSGLASFEGEQSQVALSASIAAVNSMTLPLSRELSRHGIRVCTISPGYFKTPLLSKVPQKILDFLIAQTPFPSRLGQPAEYAMTAQTIIENPYLNGEIIRLDAGLRPSH